MKVLIVDDSVVFRMAIKQAIGEIEGVEVKDVLSNGQLAIDYLKKHNDIDLVTLDMEMPVLDGMATIKLIREFNKKITIIVFSSLTTKGAEKTIEALSWGANDFVTKEEVGGATSLDKSLEMIRTSLLPKIKAFQKMVKLRVQDTSASAPAPLKNVNKGPVSSTHFSIKPKLILIASSTGGPETLNKIFKDLRKGNNVPILLVQHMPPMFTAKLAEMLSNISPGYYVKEGVEGEELQNNTCYIAPGDYHMTLDEQGKIRLDQGEKVCFVRPAANRLFDSVALYYHKQTMTIVLTGMGEDGAEGVLNLARNGSYCFYQDQASCAVWGMPQAVEKTGQAQEVLLQNVANLINEVNMRI